MTRRMIPADRKAAILDAAVTVAEKNGFANLRMAHIAERAECSNALIVNYFKTMTQMRRAVMREAIKREILCIIANGVAMGDPSAAKVDHDLKVKALATLAG